MDILNVMMNVFSLAYNPSQNFFYLSGSGVCGSLARVGRQLNPCEKTFVIGIFKDSLTGTHLRFWQVWPGRTVEVWVGLEDGECIGWRRWLHVRGVLVLHRLSIVGL